MTDGDAYRAGQWKHGWIPADAAAALEKFHGRVPKGWSPKDHVSLHPENAGQFAVSDAVLKAEDTGKTHHVFKLSTGKHGVSSHAPAGNYFSVDAKGNWSRTVGGRKIPMKDRPAKHHFFKLEGDYSGNTMGRSDTWAQRGSDLKYGHGSALWDYWTKGEGFAKWSGAVHKWTSLRDLLLKAGVPAVSADGLTTNIIMAVMPGYMKLAHAKAGHQAGRAEMAEHGHDVMDRPAAPAVSRAEYMRLYALEDIHILRSADGGDGRTVEAYAAVFGEPAEIQDHEGHYVEVIDPAAFNRAIDHASRARGGFPGSVKVLWNHGRDLSGAASDRFSMPIGIPVDIRAEARGLLTRTRYSETPLADEVLENIRAGSITSQSFTGRIMRSDPQLRRGDRYRPDHAGNLRTVRRTELGLREYGPVLWPAYSGAEIVGVRMSTPGTYALDPDETEEALPLDEEPAAGDPLTRTDGDEHSARYHQHSLFVLRSKEAREKAGLVW